MPFVTVWARVALPGYHYWPDAPHPREYLGERHRHLFIVRVEVAVPHDDRAVEFHDLLDLVREWWGDCPRECGPASCETLAKQLARFLDKRGLAVSTVDISEDGECGATVRFE